MGETLRCRIFSSRLSAASNQLETWIVPSIGGLERVPPKRIRGKEVDADNLWHSPYSRRLRTRVQYRRRITRSGGRVYNSKKISLARWPWRRAVSRGNARQDLFFKEADFEAFEQLIAEGLQKFPVDLLAYQFQDDDHFHVVCRYVERNALTANLVKHAEDYRWGSLSNWLGGESPIELAPWPVRRLPRWVERVNQAFGKKELVALRSSVTRSVPYGDDAWAGNCNRQQWAFTPIVGYFYTKVRKP